jgi:Ca2+-binding RTX toxin-like protein
MPITLFVLPASNANAAVTLVNTIPTIDPYSNLLVSAGLVGDKFKFTLPTYTSGSVSVSFTNASSSVVATLVSGTTFQVTVPAGATTGPVSVSNNRVTTSAGTFQLWKSRGESYVMPTGHLNITYSDLKGILDQIKMAEAHAKRTGKTSSQLSANSSTSALIYPYDVTSTSRCLTADDVNSAGTSTYGATGYSAPYIWTAEDPLGLRTVDGSCNNISQVKTVTNPAVPADPSDSSAWGAGNQTFPRISPQYNLPSASGLTPTQELYKNPTTTVTDSTPREISNLIADQSINNPAAVAAAYEAMDILYGATGYTTEPAVNATTGTAEPVLVIPNITADYNVSAGYNSWFTLFGQFFDHGLDLIPKGGAAVAIPLGADDPLWVNDPNAPNMMILTRASDANGQSINETTPWIDQSQTYGSHAAQNFFVREYTISSSGSTLTAVPNGRLLDGADGGVATWKDVKAQALKLGILLKDTDARSVPVIATNQYGKFIAGPNGFPMMLFQNTSNQFMWKEGSLSVPLATEITGWKAVGSGHAFLNDTTAAAVPFGSGQCSTNKNAPLAADNDRIINSSAANPNCLTYDNEGLDAHLVAGDGRINENIGLSAIHGVFHNEHNLLVTDIKNMISNDPILSTAFVNEWKIGTNWNGERLYQAARWVMEMEYQHMAFDEFIRRLAPELPVFLTYSPAKNGAISAEFASAVYRLGHSMLNETIARANPGTFYDPTNNQDVSLLTAFTNPSQARLVRPAIIASASHSGSTFTYRLQTGETAPATGAIVSISNLVDSGYNILDAVVASSNGTSFTVNERYAGGTTPAAISAPVNATTSSKTVCDPAAPTSCSNYAAATISDPGLNNKYDYSPEESYAAIAQGMSSQRGNEIDEFVSDGVRNNLLGLPLDLASLNITRGRDVGLPTLNQFRTQYATALRPYTSWRDFIENGLRHMESGLNFIAAYGTHPSVVAAKTTAAKRAAGTAITTAAKTVDITDALGNGTTITYTGFNTYSPGQVISITDISGAASSCNVDNVTVTAADVTTFTVTSSASCSGYMQANAKLSSSGGTATYVSNGTNTLTPTPPVDAVDFYNSTGAYATTESGFNYIDLWMGGLAENPAKQPILAPMLGTTFQYIFTEQMQKLQDNDRFYYLSRLVGFNLFGEIPAQKFTDIVRRNTPSAASGNLTATKGILGMNNPGFAISDCAYSSTPALVPAIVRCGSGTMKIDAQSGALTHKGLDNVTIFANPVSQSRNALSGGDGDDSIQGSAGNDYLSGGASGGDLIDGAAGDDIILGGPGEDLLKGGAGNDVINSGTSQIGDIADGGSGSDFMHCGQCTGVVTSFIGEAGNDFIQGGKAADLALEGGDGDDWIESGDGWDIVDGDNGPLLNVLINMPYFYGGNDVLNGQGGQDVIFADGGDDIILLGDGPSFPDGTWGFDWADYEYNIRFDNSPTLRPNTWADLSGALINPNTGRSNDILVNIEGLSGSSGNDQLFGGVGTADIVIPRTNGRAYANTGSMTITLPGALNIAGGSIISGPGIAPNTFVMALVGLVTANSTTIQITSPTIGSVTGPILITTAPLVNPSLITNLPSLTLGTPGNTKYTATDATSTKWSGGGIILGGDGNDTIYPSNGADVLHGSAYLHACISITKSPVPTAVATATDVVCGSSRGFSNMTILAPFMDNGTLSPADLQIVREILPTSTRVTGVSATGTSVTYTAANKFFVGELISITGLISAGGADLMPYVTRISPITAVTPTSFSIASTAPVLAALNDLTGGIAVGSDILDLSGGQTLSPGTAPVPGGGISGPASQFTFRSITTALPVGASFGCTMTDSVSGAVVTLYDFQRIKFDTGNVQNISPLCGGNNLPSAPATPTAVAGSLSATVTWVAPADNGSPIDSYQVRYSVSRGASNVTPTSGTCVSIVAPTLSCTVAGLTATSRVTFDVRAHNATGFSSWSRSSSSVTILAGTLATPTVGTIGIVPTTFKVGDAAFAVTNPTATSNGTAVTGTWAYTSSNPALLTVSRDPVTFISTMTIVAAGSVTITGTFTPTVVTPAVFTTATATRSITIAAAGSAITPTLSAITYTPSPLTPTTTSFTITNPSVLDGSTVVTGTFAYTSSNASVFTITGNTANVVAPGTALINLSFVPTDPKYATTTASVSVTVPSPVGQTPPPVQTPTPAGNVAAIVTTPAAASYSAISTVKLSVPSAGTARTVFTTNTAGCKIIGTDLTAAGALTCHVVANILTTPAQITATDIAFTLANQDSLRISNTVSTTARGNTLILRISGGSGSGAVTYNVVSDNGATCSVTNGVLTSSTAGKCSVTATKAASSIYNSVSSNPKEFIFN